MMVAQRLYEAGHITYMRTDSLNLSALAIDAIAKEINGKLGENYLKTRHYHTKSKGAQEAHEAIRPTDISMHSIDGSAQEKKLYGLIWKRTIASQMADAEIEKTTVEIEPSTRQEHFTATGEVIKFDGFLKVYIESKDDEELGGRLLASSRYKRRCSRLGRGNHRYRAFYPAASALYRGVACEENGRARYRSTVDLRSYDFYYTDA